MQTVDGRIPSFPIAIAKKCFSRVAISECPPLRVIISRGGEGERFAQSERECGLIKWSKCAPACVRASRGTCCGFFACLSGTVAQERWAAGTGPDSRTPCYECERDVTRERPPNEMNEQCSPVGGTLRPFFSAANKVAWLRGLTTRIEPTPVQFAGKKLKGTERHRE